MSKKNNPIIIRLGIHSVKKYINQNYGKSYINYINNYLLQFSIFNYIKHHFNKKLKFYSYIEIFWLKKFILINLYYIKNFNYWDFLEELKYITLPKKIKVRLYQKNIFNTTTLLLNCYTNYLINKDITPKKKLLIYIFLLNKSLNTSKIIYTKQGPVKIFLIGYKIKFCGRVENTKTQMAKNISYKIGKISLMTLNNHIDFLSKTIYSKLGNYSLNIWLYYKIQNL